MSPNCYSDMSLALGLYHFSPSHRLNCAKVLEKREHRVSWEAWVLALEAPFNPLDEDLHLVLLHALHNNVDLPKLTHLLLTFLANISRLGTLKVREAYSELRHNWGCDVMVSVLTGYHDTF